mgnify:CR=1 FL=1
MLNVIKQLKPKHFKEMAAIEAKYYSGDFITDWEDAYEWYLYSEDTCVAVAEQNQVVAFMNLFPISDQFYNLIETGATHDGYLELSDVHRVRDALQSCYSLFLSCLAVHPSFRKTDALNLVIKEYANRYLSYVGQGISFNKVITHNVTQDGARFSERMGFNQINILENNTTVAQAQFDCFIHAMCNRGGLLP